LVCTESASDAAGGADLADIFDVMDFRGDDMVAGWIAAFVPGFQEEVVPSRCWYHFSLCLAWQGVPTLFPFGHAILHSSRS
jgi:hypothetical protein